MSPHRILTEPSLQMHPGKGREGKGREERRWLRFIHNLRYGSARVMDGGFAASNGGTR